MPNPKRRRYTRLILRPLPLWPYVLVLFLLMVRYLPPPFLVESDFLLTNQILRWVLAFPILFLAVLRLMRGYRIHAVTAGIAAIVLFAEMVYYLPSNQDKDLQAADTSAITCMTYNVQGNWKKAFAYLQNHKPDIVALQEVHYPHFVLDSADLKTLGYQYHTGELIRGRGGSICLLIQGRILRTGTITFSKPHYRQRQAPYVDAVVNGYSIRIATMHLASVLNLADPGGLFSLLPYRYFQAEELADSIETWNQRRVILLGDMNSVPTDRAALPIRHLLTDTWMQAGYGLGATWHSSQPLHRIDYVFQRGFSGAADPVIMNEIDSDHLGYKVTLVP
ncbi:hypothetical protein GF324_03275 [bacterium]|nr:hypothetical protein [bacterium]